MRLLIAEHEGDLHVDEIRADLAVFDTLEIVSQARVKPWLMASSKLVWLLALTSMTLATLMVFSLMN